MNTIFALVPLLFTFTSLNAQAEPKALGCAQEAVEIARKELGKDPGKVTANDFMVLGDMGDDVYQMEFYVVENAPDYILAVSFKAINHGKGATYDFGSTPGQITIIGKDKSNVGAACEGRLIYTK